MLSPFYYGQLNSCFCMINVFVTDTIIVNLLERSTCLVILNLSVSNCSGVISPQLEDELQQTAATIIMARSMIEAFAPSILSLFIGPWSDTNGRRPLLLYSLLGKVQSDTIIENLLERSLNLVILNLNSSSLLPTRLCRRTLVRTRLRREDACSSKEPVYEAKSTFITVKIFTYIVTTVESN